MPQKKTPGKHTNESAQKEASPAKAAKAPARTRKAAPAPEQSNGSHEVSYEAIAAKAYALWESRGRPDGSPQEDWYRAQQELGI